MAESVLVKLVIRQSSGEQFEVEVKASATVLELKTACTEGCKLGPEQQRLIFKGKSSNSNIIRTYFEGRTNTRIIQD
jgi:hypothetical protein